VGLAGVAGEAVVAVVLDGGAPHAGEFGDLTERVAEPVHQDDHHALAA
jgi:hypothetical protein